MIPLVSDLTLLSLDKLPFIFVYWPPSGYFQVRLAIHLCSSKFLLCSSNVGSSFLASAHGHVCLWHVSVPPVLLGCLRHFKYYPSKFHQADSKNCPQVIPVLLPAWSNILGKVWRCPLQFASRRWSG